MKPPRSTAHPPLFQVMFVWQNMPAGELTIPGLTIRAVETPLQTAQFELTLSLREAGDDIVGHLNYASALFDESTVRRYVTYWCRLLEGMTAGPANVSVARLPLLDEAERKQVVYAWNATERDYPIEQCIHQLFEAQVDRKPEAIALTFDGQRLSYAELNARANRLAHYLQARGVGPDRLVALCAERGIEMVVGLLAILKAGGAYVPLDPSHPPERLRRMLDDTNPVAVLVDDIGADALASFESHVAARSPRVHLSRDIAQWRACSPANPSTPRERAARRLAYVIYTSGSSGEPKGVMNEHRGVVNRLWWMQQTYALDERDAVLQKTPFSFDVSVWEFFWPLMSGARLVIAKPEGHKDPAYLSELIDRERVTTLHFVPSMLQAFLEDEGVVPIRIPVDGNERFVSLLNGVSAELRHCYRHQRFPIAELNRRLGLVRTGRRQLFDLTLSFEKFPLDFYIGDVKLGLTSMRHRFEQTPITVNVQDYHEDQDLVMQFNYDVNAFSHAEVDNIGTRIGGVLDALIEHHDDMPVGMLPLLDEAERKQVVYAWNATERDYPIEQCIHQLFEAQVDRKPEAIALTFDGQRLGYAELNARANRLAHYLQARGVGPDRLVALCAERGIEMVVGLLAILKAGGAYVPLDPSHPPERLRRMLDDTNPVAVLVDDIGADALASFESHVAARSPRVHLSRDIAQWRACSPANPPTPRERAARRLAYVIYTSGSSGEPKGVMNEHRGVVNRLWWMQQTYALDERDAVLQKTPFSFDVSVWEFFWPLMSGARLVIAKPEGHKDPAYLSELIDRERVTTLHFVPSMLQAFLEDEGAARGCGSVKRVMCSGEALPPSLVKRFYRCLPDARLHNLYGPTEAAVDVTAWACDAEEGGASVPIGRPIANTRIYVLDEYGQPVPRGVAGELYIGGVQVARGYLNRPELTRERFVDDPFVAGGRLYKTGDLARWRTDGSLEYLGRNDFQVKIRGFRIELGEIEAQLAKVAGVRETVVLAREAAPDTKRHAASNENSASNSGEKRLVAYYTGDADATALRAQAAQHLPSYMVPSAYVRLDAWPLTPNGKLDRHALPAPADDAYARAEYEAPQGAKEEALAAIWKDLLPVERISRHDNFFELGGHSLLAITLIEHMRRANLHADVTTLFTAPTLADLAVRVGASRGDTYVPPNLIPGDAANGTPESAEVEELRL
ncbi:peptide synthetase [Burkholderia pseudomallei]|nr:peptide synthetase [Burkholderia pseudomallei]